MKLGELLAVFNPCTKITLHDEDQREEMIMCDTNIISRFNKYLNCEITEDVHVIPYGLTIIIRVPKNLK